jgi:nucleoside-diphosphate-sugar epimerase
MKKSEMKNILLTGGTGFLGSNILEKIIDRYNVIMLKRSFSDLTRLERKGLFLNQGSIKAYDIDRISLEEVFQKEKIDIILHCATNYGRGYKDPMEVISANLIMPLKLLELGRQNGVMAFINTDTILDKRVNYYSLSKNNFKEWLKTYSNDLICINIANAHFYGPNDDKTKFISFIIDGMMRKVEKIDLTPGKQKRDFIYVDDVVNGFLKVLENLKTLDKSYHHFEIGTNVQVEIKEVVLLIKELTGNSSTQLNFGALAYRENEIMELNIDTLRLRGLGWASRYSLREGLLNTIFEERKLYKINVLL